MRSVRISACLIVAAFGSVSCASLPAGAQAPVPGTYELRACTEPCTPGVSPSEVVGTLVLAETPFSLERVPTGVRHHLQESEEWLLAALEDRQPNACFTLARSRPTPESFLGASPVGVTEWRAVNNSLSVRLWITPDAGYVAQFSVGGTTMTGRGHAWAPGVAYHATRELILLTRSGPPVLDRCFEAEAVRRP